MNAVIFIHRLQGEKGMETRNNFVKKFNKSGPVDKTLSELVDLFKRTDSVRKKLMTKYIRQLHNTVTNPR